LTPVPEFTATKFSGAEGITSSMSPAKERVVAQIANIFITASKINIAERDFFILSPRKIIYIIIIYHLFPIHNTLHQKNTKYDNIVTYLLRFR
jgi:hypothetical protein